MTMLRLDGVNIVDGDGNELELAREYCFARSDVGFCKEIRAQLYPRALHFDMDLAVLKPDGSKCRIKLSH